MGNNPLYVYLLASHTDYDIYILENLMYSLLSWVKVHLPSKDPQEWAFKDHLLSFQDNLLDKWSSLVDGDLVVYHIP